MRVVVGAWEVEVGGMFEYRSTEQDSGPAPAVPVGVVSDGETEGERDE
jgi:hypothetical protein